MEKCVGLILGCPTSCSVALRELFNFSALVITFLGMAWVINRLLCSSSLVLLGERFPRNENYYEGKEKWWMRFKVVWAEMALLFRTNSQISWTGRGFSLCTVPLKGYFMICSFTASEWGLCPLLGMSGCYAEQGLQLNASLFVLLQITKLSSSSPCQKMVLTFTSWWHRQFQRRTCK